MATRDIILLRHAHAEPATAGQADADRPLSALGNSEAEAAGAWLKRHGVEPDCLLSSPAARARQTLDRVVAVAGYTDVREDERIYEATPGDLIRVLDDHPDADCIVVVGHNPGLESLVSLLADGASDNGRGMPPAAIAWLRMDEDAPLEPGTAEVRHFWWP